MVKIRVIRGKKFEADMLKRIKIIRQMLQFLAEEKKYWLIPLVILLLIIGLLVVFINVLAPFFYPLA